MGGIFPTFQTPFPFGIVLCIRMQTLSSCHLPGILNVSEQVPPVSIVCEGGHSSPVAGGDLVKTFVLATWREIRNAPPASA